MQGMERDQLRKQVKIKVEQEEEEEEVETRRRRGVKLLVRVVRASNKSTLYLYSEEEILSS